MTHKTQLFSTKTESFEQSVTIWFSDKDELWLENDMKGNFVREMYGKPEMKIFVLLDPYAVQALQLKLENKKGELIPYFMKEFSHDDAFDKIKKFLKKLGIPFHLRYF